MEGKSARPAKQVKVGVTAADGFKIKVKTTAAVAPKPRPLPTDNKPQTVSDYIPPSLDDPQIDKAIDDIIVSESNEILAAEDFINRPSIPVKKKKKHLVKRFFTSKWLYIGLGVIVIGLFAVPYSRYQILGQFVKNEYQLTVIDSVTKQPVSGALVAAGKVDATTNSLGEAKLKLPLGKHKYEVSKHFYSSSSGQLFVGFSIVSRGQPVQLKATGRQVPITVINKLTGKRLESVKISVLNTNAITNSDGQTNIVLPTKSSSYRATITRVGFNTLSVPIQVTASDTNVIDLVPAGSIYYLSNATGQVNVIKANLDGSNPTVELAGTGNESAQDTILMASPDWNYLVLEAKRNGSQPELYVINTSTGNIDEFDSSPDNFNLIGWSGDQFIYDEVNSSADPSTVGREEIKSYNALNGQLNVLDENQVDGSSPSYAYQAFSNFELLPDLVVYATTWTSVGSYDLSSANDTIRGVAPSGLNKKDYYTFPSSTTGQISFIRYQPAALYISVASSSTSQTSYYGFADGAVSASSISATTFAAAYPTYYLSPSGVSSLWSSTGSGTAQTLIGNSSGQNGQAINLPAGYTTTGWYDNLYILLTEGSRLYIAPATGTNSPTLIGNYLSG